MPEITITLKKFKIDKENFWLKEFDETPKANINFWNEERKNLAEKVYFEWQIDKKNVEVDYFVHKIQYVNAQISGIIRNYKNALVMHHLSMFIKQNQIFMADFSHFSLQTLSQVLFGFSPTKKDLLQLLEATGEQKRTTENGHFFDECGENVLEEFLTSEIKKNSVLKFLSKSFEKKYTAMRKYNQKSSSGFNKIMNEWRNAKARNKRSEKKLLKK